MKHSCLTEKLLLGWTKYCCHIFTIFPLFFFTGSIFIRKMRKKCFIFSSLYYLPILALVYNHKNASKNTILHRLRHFLLYSKEISAEGVMRLWQVYMGLFYLLATIYMTLLEAGRWDIKESFFWQRSLIILLWKWRQLRHWFASFFCSSYHFFLHFSIGK